MTNDEPVFIDANALIYFLDETAAQHDETVALLQELINDGAELFTSHHVLEEVLYIVSRLSSEPKVLSAAVEQIASIPDINLIEPEPTFDFARDYINLYATSKVGINDTLLLQLMIDAGLKKILSFDVKLIQQASLLDITPASL